MALTGVLAVFVFFHSGAEWYFYIPLFAAAIYDERKQERLEAALAELTSMLKDAENDS